MQCENCRNQSDKLTPLNEKFSAPQPGALNICAYCGLVSVYQEDLSLRPLNEEDWTALEKQLPEMYNRLRKTQRTINEHNRNN